MKMTKNELRKALENATAKMYEFKLDSLHYAILDDAENLLRDKKAPNDELSDTLELVTAHVAELEKTQQPENSNAENNKKQVEKKEKEKPFKWSKIDGYELQKINSVKFENIEKSDIIAFRMDNKTIEKLIEKYGNEYGENITYKQATFSSELDICDITKISENSIALKSRDNGVKITVYADNFKKLVDDMGVPFMVYKKAV